MTELLDRCSVCESFVDTEDLFCANCGTEGPRPEGALEVLETTALNFACHGCGASMNYDAGAQALRCPFCGSAELKQGEGGGIVKPDQVVPFRIERDEIRRRFREWCGRGFWRPSDLRKSARLTEITSVFIPGWIFQARTDTYWTADSSVTPPGASGDWFPVFGEDGGEFEGILVPASGGLTSEEITATSPFDLGEGIPPGEVDLEDITVEQFALSRKYARPVARATIRELLREKCRRRVPGRARNVHVNVLFSDVAGRPMLLPFWILAYRYRDKVYRFVANGQSGRITGDAPTSWLKIAAIFGVALLLVLVLIGLLL